jgi:hypothetical protein
LIQDQCFISGPVSFTNNIMPNQKRDTINSIRTAIIVAFLLLLVSSFSEKTSKRSCYSTNALNSDFRANNDIITDALSLPSLQKSCLPLLLKLFSDNNKTFSDNRKIFLKFILLQKTQLSIEPLTPCRFYYHLFSNDAEDLPALS